MSAYLNVEAEIQRQRWRDAGSHLLKHLLSLKVCGKITAQDFCVCAHYCKDAGVLGVDWARYALEP
eukprot:1801050-Pyramimonas_sp.AAC.1